MESSIAERLKTFMGGNACSNQSILFLFSEKTMIQITPLHSSL